MFHYRVDFLNALRARLKEEGIELVVYYGNPTQQSKERQDSEILPWATEITTKSITIAGKEILLQIPPRKLFKSNVIICMQENRLLINYFLQLITLFKPQCHFTFFGHGRNFQSIAQQGIRERFKKIIVGRSDHFFAYTELSKQALLSSGYSEAKITVVNNTIDADIFSSKVRNVSQQAIAEYKSHLGLPDNAVVALFCGSIYDLKKPSFLIEAVDRIKTALPELHLIVVGAGPTQHVIEEASSTRDWIHYQGMQKGDEKTLAYASCKIILNPGLVGLHIVDALSAGKPMITTNMPYHSPEYAYLENNVNGIVTEENVESYASVVIELLTDDDKLRTISEAALSAKDNYSLANMVDAFTKGIKTVLPSKGASNLD